MPSSADRGYGHTTSTQGTCSPRSAELERAEQGRIRRDSRRRFPPPQPCGSQPNPTRRGLWRARMWSRWISSNGCGCPPLLAEVLPSVQRAGSSVVGVVVVAFVVDCVEERVDVVVLAADEPDHHT